MAFKYKISRRLALSRLVACVAAAGVACAVEGPAVPDGQLELTILPESVAVNPLEQVRFEAFVIPADGQPERAALQAVYGASYTAGDHSLPMTWAATGGIVGKDGRYAAGDAAGVFRVIVTSSENHWADTAVVIVTDDELVPVSSVSIAPANATLAAGSSARLTATLYDAEGAVITGRAIDWSSSDTDVATVSAGGLVSAVAEGSTVISATSGGVTGTAGVTVGDAPVSSVTVSPSSATMGLSETLQLTAELRDSSGNVLAGRYVEWMSDDAGVASVSSAGVVTGGSPGVATVTARSDGVSGTAQITVADDGPELARECASARAEWIWCDDFEQDRSNQYFEYDSHSGDFVRAASVGVDGSTGMRARWSSAGQVNAGNLKVAFGVTPDAYFRSVDAGTADYRELYWRVYLKHQAGWIGGGGDKLARATVFANANWAQAMIAHVWSAGNPADFLALDPASGTDESGGLRTGEYNDFANLRWLGLAQGATPIFDDAHVGRWYCIETRVRLNDIGQANGVFELWIDGVLEARRGNLNWLGGYRAYGLNALILENYWNDGAPAAQERYFDNLVVSTQPIGCGSPDAPPNPDGAVASVSVAPQTAIVEENTYLQLVAQAHDAAGNALSNRTVTWSSNAPAVASVDANGRVHAASPGSATVTAAVEGKSAAASLTVTEAAPPPPPNGGAHPNEPVGYERFAENRFDVVPSFSWNTTKPGILAGGWWNHPGDNPNTQAGSDDTAPVSPSKVVRTVQPVGLPGGSAGINFGGWHAAGESIFMKKVYFSMWFKLANPTYYQNGNLQKIGYFSVGNERGGGNEIMIMVPGEGRGHNAQVTDFTIRIDRQDGLGLLTRFELPNHNRQTKRIRTQTWHHLEIVMELNDIGVPNGIFRMWLDGVLLHDWRNWKFVDDATPVRANGFSGWKYNPVWGGGGSPLAGENVILIDHVYMSGVR